MKDSGIGVVLVNYHTIDQIINIALKYSSFECIQKVVIVNNETYPKEKELLTTLQNSKIDVIFEEKNIGYSNGNNIGIKHLINTPQKPNYIIISNSDIQIDEFTIKKVIEKLEQLPDFGAMAPRMLTSDGKTAPLRFFDVSYKMLFLRCFVKNLDHKTEKYLKEYTKDIFIQHALPGSFFICRVQALIDCGMFDQGIFLYGEEEILGKRMNNANYKLGIVNNLYYKHNHDYSKETITQVIQHTKLDFVSERYYFKTYLSASRTQIVYVYFCETIYMLKHIIGHIIAKMKRARPKH